MLWICIAATGILLVGYLIIWIAIFNRVHALPLKNRRLKRFRHVSYLMIPGLPALLLFLYGWPWTTHPLTTGENGSSVKLAWSVLSVLCLGGVFWGCWCGVRRFFIQSPWHLLSVNSTFYDIARDLGRVPLSDSGLQAIGHWLWNEQFQLEFSRKEIFVPGLPPQCDGLSILHLSDFHYQGAVTREYFIRALEIAKSEPFDLACFTGDLLDNIDLLNWLAPTLGELKPRFGKYFILGNHDWCLEPHSIREELTALGWQDVSVKEAILNLDGVRFGIAGDETPWVGQHPTFNSELDFRLLLGHTPDNIGWAQAQQIDLMLSGHNHGGQVKLPVIGPVFAPSRFGVKYTDGLFFEEPTILHVVRGLSGDHPFRWHCMPEISRLILRSGKPGVPTAPR